MAPPKRKTSDYVSDGFVENDGDSDRPSKRAKAPASSSRSPYFSSTTVQADSEGNRYWEISKSRRVTISEFKGRQMVSVREYYEQGGKTLPGKKGISLPMDQYGALVSLLPEIEKVLQQKGEKVPRPKYDRTANEEGKEDQGAEIEAEGAKDAGGGADKKLNYESTSDEN